MPSVQVPACAVSIAVSHISVAALVLDGMEPRAAFEHAFYTFKHVIYRELMRGVSFKVGWLSWSLIFPRERPGGDWFGNRRDGGLAPTPPGKGWTTRCFTEACRQNRAALTMDPAAYAEKVGWPGHPACELTEAAVARLGWQMSMMFIYASGGGNHDLCQCARIALDRDAGKPRKRREPVAHEWLKTEVNGALDDGLGALNAVFGERR